jgi:hypothetical protein
MIVTLATLQNWTLKNQWMQGKKIEVEPWFDLQTVHFSHIPNLIFQYWESLWDYDTPWDIVKLFHKLLEPIKRHPSIPTVLATHEKLHLNPLTIQPPYMHCSMVSFHFLTSTMCTSLNYKLLNTYMLYDSPYLALIQIQHQINFRI